MPYTHSTADAGVLTAEEEQVPSPATSGPAETPEPSGSDEALWAIVLGPERGETLEKVVKTLRHSLQMTARYAAMYAASEYPDLPTRTESVEAWLRQVIAKDTLYELRRATEINGGVPGAFTEALRRFWSNDELAALAPIVHEALMQLLPEIEKMATTAVKETAQTHPLTPLPASETLFLDMEHAFGQRAVWTPAEIEKLVGWAVPEARRRGKTRIVVETEDYRFQELSALLASLPKVVRAQLGQIELIPSRRTLPPFATPADPDSDLLSPAEQNFLHAVLTGAAC